VSRETFPTSRLTPGEIAIGWSMCTELDCRPRGLGAGVSHAHRDDLSRALADLAACQLSTRNPNHCPIDEMSPLAFEAWMQTDVPRENLSHGTHDRTRAAAAAERLRGGWRPT
jgi:hypothetical protein